MEKSTIEKVGASPENPGSFSSAQKIRQSSNEGEIKLSGKTISKWLETEDFHTLHRERRNVTDRPKVIAPFPFYQFDSDTAYMTNFPHKQNEGYKFFVVFIDVFSKYAYAYPVRATTGSEMVTVMKDLFSKTKKPEKLRTDLGVEFKNKMVADFLKHEKIDHFFAESDKKANVAEQFIKTIKSKLLKYMVKNKTAKWVHVLDDLVSSYNNTPHRSIGKPPAMVKLGDSFAIWNKVYEKMPNKPFPKWTKKHHYKLGDNVRISLVRHPYAKAYDEYWTREIFTITKLKFNQYIPQYEIKDWHNEPIGGSFYQGELQRVNVVDDTQYDVEKIVRKRTVRGEKQYFVKWKGWPNSFNSWISSEQVSEYK